MCRHDDWLVGWLVGLIRCLFDTSRGVLLDYLPPLETAGADSSVADNNGRYRAVCVQCCDGGAVVRVGLKSVFQLVGMLYLFDAVAAACFFFTVIFEDVELE